MSRTILLAFAVILGANVSASAETVKVGVAAMAVQPFYVPDASGKFSGWEIDVMSAICEDQKLDCQVVPLAWDGLIPALTSGQIDMIMSSMSITDARKQIIDFSDKYYTTPGTIVGPKNVQEGVAPNDLKGKVIGIVVANIHQKYAQKHFTDSEIKTYKSTDEVRQDLVAGRIDATLDDRFGLEDWVSSDAGSCCEIKGNVKYDPAIYGPGIGAGIRKDDAGLKNKINTGIKDIRANGKYDEITRRYFKTSIYGD
ncbi:transporter substrate-binding domain-containing protein [Phyllobacterium myrsinacearum]|uniref:Amino acid ABC transporter n=1 Tax=Phyllobacterium myrsinacearum TaxID=28101 RepID=A0A2S9JR49_9HYPH|nr:amino acid ABC transporter [Phyllobacterium myrsinacearum]PWV91907.1 amino acid ABC transporter substrate-binding protein (PAAT family) [Phyllobacterium myrsinacearum]RZS77255.1 amino acid ABC transporter substrate-binding protein (PAAT family) [Phyllobacterium myrsinacearum]RZV05974.1 amino acid ABC transporter substrate-binding protein (PAAT family) [Phyllobacterium myrsinacearum]